MTTDAAVSGITKKRLFDGRRYQRVKQMEPFRLSRLVNGLQLYRSH